MHGSTSCLQAEFTQPQSIVNTFQNPCIVKNVWIKFSLAFKLNLPRPRCIVNNTSTNFENKTPQSLSLREIGRAHV